MDLAEITNVETSPVTGRLVKGSFNLYIKHGDVGEQRTFHLVDFHCHLLHEG